MCTKVPDGLFYAPAQGHNIPQAHWLWQQKIQCVMIDHWQEAEYISRITSLPSRGSAGTGREPAHHGPGMPTPSCCPAARWCCSRSRPSSPHRPGGAFPRPVVKRRSQCWPGWKSGKRGKALPMLRHDGADAPAQAR